MPTLAAGNYVLVVDGVSGSAGSYNLTAQLGGGSSGSGDTCASPIALTLTGAGSTESTTITGTTVGATHANHHTCSSSTGAPDRVYAFTTSGGDLTVNLVPNSVDLGVSLWNACPSGAELACVDDSGGNETLTYPGLAAGTYYLWVDGWTSSSSGSYSMTVTMNETTASTGNTCASAIPVTFSSNFASVSGTTSGLTNDHTTTATGCSSVTGPDKFYSFTNR